MTETKEFISKGRLDALTDGVFAFAMTLLVVNLELPQDFHPKSTVELISALLGLGDTFISYVITFLVLASFLARARANQRGARSGKCRLRPVAAVSPVLRHASALLDDCCWPLQPRAGDMGVWSQHDLPRFDGNGHHARDRA